MERGFGEDFGTVTLSVRPNARGPDGAAAWTVGEHIYLAGEWYQPDTAAGRRVLAHELAHVVQKRRPAPGRPAGGGAARILIEAEAHAAAAVVTSGGRFICSVADRPEEPRAWGVAGHYYTAYFILLAAGVDNATAAQMAFFAQMPDQVDELDATSAGIEYMAITTNSGQYGGPSFYDARALARDLDVQMGLHSLTGRGSTEETKLRRERLEGADFGSFEFGLAIHPYGDSFAHRRLGDPSRMYAPPMGHAIEAVSGRDAHAPDFLQTRPALYREYAEGLYDIVCDKMPNRQRLLTRADLASRLAEVSGVAGDISQIAALRNIAGRDLCQLMGGYRPESEDLVVWQKFRGAHPELPQDLRDRALTLAHTWSAPR
jgi:hypothetical protein